MQYRVDYSDKHNLHNWVEKLDLVCVSSKVIGLLGSSFFIGWACTLLWAPRLADIYGRSKIYRIAMVLVSINFCLYYVCFNVYFMIAICFMNGALTSVRSSTGFIYMQEFVKSHKQPTMA